MPPASAEANAKFFGFSRIVLRVRLKPIIFHDFLLLKREAIHEDIGYGTTVVTGLMVSVDPTDSAALTPIPMRIKNTIATSWSPRL